MAEVQSTIAGGILIAAFSVAFMQVWQSLGIDIHWAADILVPFVLALAATFGVAVAYYAVRARRRSR